MHTFTRTRLRLVELSILLVLLPALAGAAQAAVRFDVYGSPTEVINTGRSEVLGSINLIVRGSGSLTGTSSGGPAQIGFIFDHPALQIDNNTSSGILIYVSPGFAAAGPTLIGIENRQIGGRCMGVMTLNLLAGATPAEGDFIRIEGIRGRVDLSEALAPGTDLFVDLQSINDPAANSFYPDRLRVAKSFAGMTVDVNSDASGFQIRIAEGFARAFIDRDAGDDGIGINDRTDSAGGALGAPANSTRVIIELDGIPGGVSQVAWPSVSTAFAGTGALLRLQSSTFSPGAARATYSFEALDQTGSSDLYIESFVVLPGFVFTGGDCNTGNLSANVTLGPAAELLSGCASLAPDAARPRFLESFAVLIRRLDPATVVVGGPPFTLKLHGAGFTPDAAVQWNGDVLPATYISRSQLEVSIPAERIAHAGTATVTVISPSSPGGPESNSATLAIKAHVLSLLFPRLAAGGPGEITGIALVNFSGRTVSLTLTAYDRLGAKISGAGILNPAVLTLTAGQQLALVDSEIFGPALRAAGMPGWIRLEGDVPGVAGFFLNFNGSLTHLDGADVSGTEMTSFVFPEVDAGTSVSIANPNEEPATILLQLVKADGTVRADATRTIAAAGLLLESARDLFPGIAPDPTDYMRAGLERRRNRLRELRQGLRRSCGPEWTGCRGKRLHTLCAAIHRRRPGLAIRALGRQSRRRTRHRQLPFRRRRRDADRRDEDPADRGTGENRHHRQQFLSGCGRQHVARLRGDRGQRRQARRQRDFRKHKSGRLPHISAPGWRPTAPVGLHPGRFRCQFLHRSCHPESGSQPAPSPGPRLRPERSGNGEQGGRAARTGSGVKAADRLFSRAFIARHQRGIYHCGGDSQLRRLRGLRQPESRRALRNPAADLLICAIHEEGITGHFRTRKNADELGSDPCSGLGWLRRDSRETWFLRALMVQGRSPGNVAKHLQPTSHIAFLIARGVPLDSIELKPN